MKFKPSLLITMLLLVMASAASADTFNVGGSVNIVEGYDDAAYFRVGYYSPLFDNMVYITGTNPWLGWEAFDGESGSFSGSIDYDGAPYGETFTAELMDYSGSATEKFVVYNQSGTTYFYFYLRERTAPLP